MTGSCALVVISLAYTLAVPSARAAGRPYAYTQGADGLPETGLEIENWFSVDRPRESAAGPEIDWWFGPVAGVTDNLEVAFYGVLVQPPVGDKTGSGIGLGALRLQASYLLADVGAWPVEVRIRAEYEQSIGAGHDDRGSPSVWLSSLASYDVGPLNLTLNVGGLAEFESDGVSPWFLYAAGTSLDLAGGLRLGAEAFGEYVFRDREVENAVGPTIGYGVGRVWAATTLGFGIGDTSARYQGRIILGLSI